MLIRILFLNRRIIDIALQMFWLDNRPWVFVHVYVHTCACPPVCMYTLLLFKSFPYGEVCFQFFSNGNNTSVNTAEFIVIHTLCVCVCVYLWLSVGKSLRFKDQMPFKRLYQITFLLKMFFKKTYWNLRKV